jgi:hypothetical protein
VPWSKAQHGLFCAAAHDAGIARSHGMSQGKAREMCAEGVKKDPRKRVAEAMVRRKK